MEIIIDLKAKLDLNMDKKIANIAGLLFYSSLSSFLIMAGIALIKFVS